MDTGPIEKAGQPLLSQSGTTEKPHRRRHHSVAWQPRQRGSPIAVIASYYEDAQSRTIELALSKFPQSGLFFVDNSTIAPIESAKDGKSTDEKKSADDYKNNVEEDAGDLGDDDTE